MNENKAQQWNLVRADGGTVPVTPERLTALKDEFTQICTDAGASANDRRELAADTRFCRWPGQTRDGRKHADEETGRKPFPYDGASDARVRLADGTANEQVMILMAALTRARITFTGAASKAMNALWSHTLNNQLAAEWFVENTKVAQWRQSNSPAVGFWQVYWKRETALRPVELSAEDFAAKLMELAAASAPEMAEQAPEPSPELAGEIEAMLSDPAMLPALADACLALYPEMPATRAKKVAASLQQDRVASFPYPQEVENRLAIKARQLFDDIFIPENTTDLKRARVIFVREWHTEVELREMESKGELNEGFVEEVLKHPGETGWEHHSHYDAHGDYSPTMGSREWDKERHRGQYELITAFFRASNADGVPGLYVTTYHHCVDQPGSDMELLDYAHGEYPFVAAKREILSHNLWDSRGVAELSATDQQSLKVLHDAFMDHAQLCTIPPVTVPAGRPKLNLVIGPLVQVKEQRQGEIKFMTMPSFPQSNGPVQDAIERRHDRYHGRMSPNTPPDLVRLYGQHLVDTFFWELREVVRQGVKLLRQFTAPEKLRRLLGAEAEPLDQSMEAILGDFDVELSFEAGLLQFDFLKAVGEMITNYALAWDTDNTMKRAELVSWFMGALSPQLARSVLRPVDEANNAEVEDEEKNFALISAGVEPEMKTTGQDFALRLDVELGIAERNPEAVAKLSPKSREIWEARIQHLQGQVMQQQNKLIGRTMARPALDGGAAA